jgi:proline iminopeptidase
MYPKAIPFNTLSFTRGIHTIAVAEYGSPSGHPVLFLHGGPGGGTSSSDTQYFDPAYYRIILIDQRGSGKSTPSASLQDNDTWALVSDIEHVRQQLGIDTWIVFGGSWGSTLSLVYAISHASSVEYLVLRGIFMLRKSELDFFYQEGNACN